MHADSLTNIALVVLMALVFGLAMTRLKQPPILGYIFAGVLLGPSGLQFIESREPVEVLAEMGVLLLLFVIGIELNLRTFKRVWVVTSLATLFQIIICVVTTWLVSFYLGWSTGLAIMMGFIISVSSTAVAVKMLESINELNSDIGQLSIGILIAQDFAIVPMILILRNFNNAEMSYVGLGSKLLLAFGIIAGLIIYLGRRQRVKIPFLADVSNQKELMPIISLTLCFAASALSGYIGLSAAYGAFLAGLTIGNTHERNQVLDTVKPIQSTLIMVFFFSVGILMDLGFIYSNMGIFVLLLLLITVGKTTINISVLRFLKVPWSQAFLVGVVLAQIGEFGFLLASVGYASGIITDFGEKLILSLTALSLLFSPVWMSVARSLTKSDAAESNSKDEDKKTEYSLANLPGMRYARLAWSNIEKQRKKEKKIVESLAAAAAAEKEEKK